MTGFLCRVSFILGQANASPSNTQGGSRMPESGASGSVRAALRNERPYRERYMLWHVRLDGRSWKGLHRRVRMTTIVYTFLQHRCLASGAEKRINGPSLNRTCRPHAMQSSTSFFGYPFSDACLILQKINRRK